jgi:hypothetical protein
VKDLMVLAKQVGRRRAGRLAQATAACSTPIPSSNKEDSTAGYDGVAHNIHQTQELLNMMANLLIVGYL